MVHFTQALALLAIGLTCANAQLWWINPSKDCPRGCNCGGFTQWMEVTCTDMQFISDLALIPSGVTILTLRNMNIPRIDVGMFNRFASLRNLVIENSAIADIAPDSFDGMGSLRTLRLPMNKLTSLDNGVFTNLTQLQTLDLESNQIANISEDVLFGLESIRDLNLGENMIENVPCDAFFGRVNLQTLSLDRNRIGAIENCTFSGLTALQTLNLQRNRLVNISEDAFVDLNNLQTLKLHQNGLSQIGNTSFKGLNQLRVLDLSMNGLTEVPTEALSALPNLQELILSENPITILPNSSFFNLTNLQDLYLRRLTNLTTIEPEAFSGLNKVRILALEGHPYLTSFPAELFPANETSAMEYLFLSNNALTEVSPNLMTPMASLKDVSLHGNPLACDCHAKWISQLTLQGNITWTGRWADTTAITSPDCASPDHLKSRKITGLDPFDLTCTVAIIDPVASQDVPLIIGETIEIEVHVSRGVPIVNWTVPSGDTYIAGDRVIIGQSEISHEEQHLANDTKISILRVTNTTTSDLGLYIITAINAGGATNLTFNVTEAPDFIATTEGPPTAEGVNRTTNSTRNPAQGSTTRVPSTQPPVTATIRPLVAARHPGKAAANSVHMAGIHTKGDIIGRVSKNFPAPGESSPATVILAVVVGTVFLVVILAVIGRALIKKKKSGSEYQSLDTAENWPWYGSLSGAGKKEHLYVSKDCAEA